MINIARAFAYTRELERTLEQLHDDFTQLAMSSELREVELKADHSSDRERLLGEIRELRAHNLALTDRICLQNRTVPVSEPLKSEAKAGTENRDQVATMVDQSIRKSGPVAGRRSEVEEKIKKAREEAEAMRERAVAPHLAATNELDDVVQS